MNIQELTVNIEKAIKHSLKELGYYDESIEVSLEQPKDKSHGDYASNIAMRYAKKARKAPIKIAEEIVEKLDKESLYLETINVVNPGFINFFIVPSFIFGVINDINKQGKQYGQLSLGKNDRYNIEFVSVNPTGSLHIGHARGAASGDSMCRILQKAGYEVTKEYYVNDAGNQIHNLALSLEARYKQLFDLDVLMPEDGYNGPEIIKLAEKIKREVNDRYLHEEGYHFFKSYGVSELLAQLKQDLADFRVEFDVWFSEQSLYDEQIVQKTLDYLKEQNYTYEQDGAIWLKTSEYGDEKDRVIVKSDGTYTYLTPDIAYHKNKLDRNYTKLIDILGGDHHGYIDRLKAAIEMVGKQSNILEVEILQMVKVIQNGEEVKMSKRSGRAITLRDIIDEVGVDPIRYFFAMRSLNTHMDLDLDLALKQTNENPVYYVQYANARIHSLFTQAEKKGINFINEDHKFTHLTGDKTIQLVHILSQYPDAIELAATNRTPHKLTNYLNQLASAFHSFYGDTQIITDDIVATKEKLALLNATTIVLEDALSLIGVSAPKKM
ncbi:MAG: arginine--tRNA ligase [Candidatus Izemoplasmataceae bacterium]